MSDVNLASTGGQQAYEINGQRASRERFYAVACDPRRSVAVQACAGAGKTWMLVSRILRALMSGAQAHEILAITFTKKAAGEMRQRLHEWLAQFAHASPEVLTQQLAIRGLPSAMPQDIAALRELYPRLLAAGRPVQIRTFHSWFAALLRNAPLAVLQGLGLPAHHELMEDDSEAIERVWPRFHGAVAADAGARADYVASVAAHGRSQTQKALKAALDKRVEFALADERGVVEASVSHFAALFPEWAELAQPSDVITQPGAARQLLADAARLLGRASAPSFSIKGVEPEAALASGELQAALGALLTQKMEPRKFNEKIQGIEQVRQAQALALRLEQASAQHEAWLHHQRMRRLAHLLIETFAQHRREHGWVDMNDVERAALVMLSDPVLSGWVQERLDARVRHLLIDEFQDTNPLQWQALHGWLSGYAGAGGQAPSVFIVGDPRQSIYRFRRAEPQVFRAAQEFVQQGLQGDVLSCDHTHRNAPALIDVVNQVMGQAQAANEYDEFRPHTTESRQAGMVSCLPAIGRERGDEDDAAASDADAWRDSLTQARELPEEKLIALECRQAAAWIAQQLDAGLAPGDIMVLARKRDRLTAMEDELRALHIPSQQPDKSDLCEAPQVQDIVALLDALVSPTHDLSLARALKSPLFGVQDDTLVALAVAARQARAQGQPVTWFELLAREDEVATGLGAIGARLREWQAALHRLPPHDALELIYQQGDVLARFAAAAPAQFRQQTQSRLRALIGAALEVGGGRYASPYGFVRALKAGGIEAPPLSQTDAVRLLTVHGAKGLEAPVVLMLDTDSAPARAETMGVIAQWPGQESAPLRFAFIASETRPPPCSLEAIEVERAARQREELNALYVAMTRARSRLVLSCVQASKSAATPSWWSRLLPHATVLPPPAPAQVRPDAAGHALRFPLMELPALAAKLQPEVASLDEADTEQARFGKAVHRLLEGWAGGKADFAAQRVHRVQREFRLSPAQAEESAAMARRILQGEAAWAWDAAQVNWQANEVPLHHQGELLRLDRLVRRAHDGQWWVLDYKTAAKPQQQEELMNQMRRYKQAVQAANPGDEVQAAFITGQGKLVAVS